MAMFECPGCKHIVDDSIKKCPNCAYDIKKYVKSVLKDAKKSGKNEDVSIALSSVYNATSKTTALPKLDFLSNIPAPAPTPTAAQAPSYSQPVAPSQPAAPQTSSYSQPMAPSQPAAPQTSSYSQPMAPSQPAMPQTPSYSRPATPSQTSSYSQPTVTTRPASTMSSYSQPSVPGAMSQIAPPAGYSAGSNEGTIKIAAPVRPAPERQPVTSNSRSMFPKPIYQEEPARTAYAQPQPQPAQPIAAAPIFDSPELNAAHAAGIRQGAPATAANVSQMASYGAPAAPASSIYNSQPTQHNFATPPTSAPAPSFAGNGMQPAMPAAPQGEELLFDSPLLNAQHQMIKNGEYVPSSSASQASMSLLEKDVSAFGNISTGVSQSMFGLGNYGQTSTYKVEQLARNDNPNLAGGNALLGSQPPKMPEAPASFQQTSFQPAYGLNSGSNVNAPNPLLAGNPLLGGNAGRQ